MTIKDETIKPGIRNTHTGEVLTPAIYKMRRDLDAYFNRVQYKLTAREIIIKHHELIASKWH